MKKENKIKIILLKTVEKLGKEGEVVEVKPGFARNYLIPKKIALKATKENFKKIEEIKKKKEQLLEKERREFLNLKEKLEKISLTITVEVKEGDEIYGTVSEVQILKALKDEGIELGKGKIVLPEPIKKLGVYNLKVNLHPQVEGNIRVWVVKK
jgi:large subunit ribosomal protein L9